MYWFFRFQSRLLKITMDITPPVLSLSLHPQLQVARSHTWADSTNNAHSTQTAAVHAYAWLSTLTHLLIPFSRQRHMREQLSLGIQSHRHRHRHWHRHQHRRQHRRQHRLGILQWLWQVTLPGHWLHLCLWWWHRISLGLGWLPADRWCCCSQPRRRANCTTASRGPSRSFPTCERGHFVKRSARCGGMLIQYV